MDKGGGRPGKGGTPTQKPGDGLSTQFTYPISALKHSAFVSGPAQWDRGHYPKAGEVFTLTAYGFRRKLKIVSIDSLNGLVYVQEVRNGLLVSTEGCT